MNHNINFKILVIEDEDSMIQILKRFFTEYSLTFCKSEECMYQKLNEDDYNLIIMDLGLPGLKDGFQITEGLKADKNFASIPIVCITSYVDHQIKGKAFKAGANDFITKPFTKTELLQIIGKYRMADFHNPPTQGSIDDK
jgi:CheY-like chemotaxis protein